MGRLRSIVAGGISATLLGGMLVLGAALPAGAVTPPSPSGDPTTDVDDVSATVEIVNTRFGSNIDGVLTAPPTAPFSYPTGGTTGTPRYAALIDVADVNNPSKRGSAYCVNISTGTNLGVDYANASWDGAGVANYTYIIWILKNYFPTQANLPASLTDTERVAAIQSAIWYFSDGFVVDSDDSNRAATQAIVEAAIANGGDTPPPAPTLSLSPTSAEAPSTAPAAGPFTVEGNATDVRVRRVSGLSLFRDEARTVPAPAGSTLTLGERLWAGSVAQSTPPASFEISADVNVQVGTVYLATPNPSAFQKIVLAQSSVLPVRASASVSVYDAAAIEVTKRIEGTAAGDQGAITLRVDCTPAPAASVVTTFTVPAGAAKGDHTFRVEGLRSGSTCTVTEIANGANSRAVFKGSTITPTSVTVPARGATTTPRIVVTDTYTTPLANTGSPADLGGAALAGLALLTGIGIVVLRRRAAAE